MIEAVETRVERGARLLDAKVPAWPSLVDPDELDVRDVVAAPGGGTTLGNRDVLGQVFGSWFAGIETLWPGHEYGRHGDLIASHGFDIALTGDSWGPLDAAWRAEVRARTRRGP